MLYIIKVRAGKYIW